MRRAHLGSPLPHGRLELANGPMRAVMMRCSNNSNMRTARSGTIAIAENKERLPRGDEEEDKARIGIEEENAHRRGSALSWRTASFEQEACIIH